MQCKDGKISLFPAIERTNKQSRSASLSVTDNLAAFVFHYLQSPHVNTFLPSHGSSSQFSLGSQEDLEEPLPLTTFHTENEDHPSSRKATPSQIKGEIHNGEIPTLGQEEEGDGEEAACSR